MEKNFDRLVNAYSDGVPIERIQLMLNKTREEILDELREYRESQFKKGKYSDDLMQVVASRDLCGAKRKDMMSELGVSRSFLVRAIEEYGLLSKAKESDTEEFFQSVDEDFSFAECLKCGSKKINTIQDGDGIYYPSGVYCMSCGSEFTLMNGIVNLVKWENVD